MILRPSPKQHHLYYKGTRVTKLIPILSSDYRLENIIIYNSAKEGRVEVYCAFNSPSDFTIGTLRVKTIQYSHNFKDIIIETRDTFFSAPLSYIIRRDGSPIQYKC